MKKKSNRVEEALLDMADGMLNCGIINEKDYEKITLRKLKKKPADDLKTMSSDDIRALREKEHLSQGAFAAYLHLSVGHVSKMERGEREPTGAVLLLLNLIQKKGLKAISL